MKKYLTKYALFLSISTLLITACTKEKSVNKNSVLLYKNKELKDSSLSGYLLGGSTNEVSTINYSNNIFDSLYDNSEWSKISKNVNLDYKNITLTSYFGTNIKVASFPVLGSMLTSKEVYYNVYISNNKHVITKMSIEILNNQNRKITIASPNNISYYQLEINTNNKIGNWHVFKDVPLRSNFNNKSTNLSFKNNSIKSNETMHACMNRCIMQVCGSDWVCASLCTAALFSCVAGAALACAIN